ncbi:hypothetical protein ACFE04_028209 [Oxalis oulophora]
MNQSWRSPPCRQSVKAFSSTNPTNKSRRSPPRTRRFSLGKLQRAKSRKVRVAYAPHIDLLPPEKMAVIVMYKMVGLVMATNDDGCVQAAIHIGQAIENEERMAGSLLVVKSQSKRMAGGDVLCLRSSFSATVGSYQSLMDILEHVTHSLLYSSYYSPFQLMVSLEQVIDVLLVSSKSNLSHIDMFPIQNEPQEHAELTSHSNFAESTEAVLNLICTTCRKPCRSKTESDMHTKRTGHAEFVDKTIEAAKPISLKAPKKAPESDDPMDTSGSDQPQELVAPEDDKTMLEELQVMGFPIERATRALHYSGNVSVEAFVNWVVEHESDPDIDQMPMKVQQELLVVYDKMLFEKEHSGVEALLKNNKREDLSRMYRLYHKITNGLEPVDNVFKQHIIDVGTALVQSADDAGTTKARQAAAGQYEVVSYFMGLVPNDAKGVVKLKDQVTNSEKWFTTSEIEGSPAVKFDLSLTKPIILMPRKTDSPDYLKLDVVHITVQNSFQWFGGGKNDINVVHLETLSVMVKIIDLSR